LFVKALVPRISARLSEGRAQTQSVAMPPPKGFRDHGSDAGLLDDVVQLSRHDPRRPSSVQPPDDEQATIVIPGLVGNDHAAYDGFAASPMATFPRAVSRVVSLLASSRVSHAFMGRPLTDAKRLFAQSISKSRRDSGPLRVEREQSKSCQEDTGHICKLRGGSMSLWRRAI
jgi:hypothetical protein